MAVSIFDLRFRFPVTIQATLLLFGDFALALVVALLLLLLFLVVD